MKKSNKKRKRDHPTVKAFADDECMIAVNRLKDGPADI